MKSFSFRFANITLARLFFHLPLLCAAALCFGLTACGGGSKSNTAAASVRLANATLTHNSLDLWVNSAVAQSATGLDTVSGYATPGSGAASLQIDDAGSSTALATIAPTLTGGSHYALVAYESGGAVHSVLLPEDWALPTTGAVNLRINDLAAEAGKLDVYVTSTALAQITDLSALSPAGGFAASTSAAVISLTYSPGTYYVTVTASGNPTDVRMMNMPVVLANQQVASVLITPASGGQLLNGTLLVQQGAMTAFRNTSTRLRLASAVSSSATVAASALSGSSSLTIDSGSVSPQFGTYALVPLGSTLSITVNGVTVNPPAGSLVKGDDMTLLVYGAPGSVSTTLMVDDNRPPLDASSVKLRLINGISGNAVNQLTLTANSATVASAVAPEAVSTYTAVTSSLNPMNLVLYSTQKAGIYYSNTSYVLNADGVYTVLAAGDFSAPFLLIR